MLKDLWHKVQITLISTVCFFSITTSANADSPLTSTDLASAYNGLSIIQKAKNAKQLEGEVLIFLLGDAPLDKKAAVINALGWNIKGQDNGELFLTGLAVLRDKNLNNLTLKDLTPSDKFVLGYLLAMDDYFDLSPLDSRSNKSLWRATPLDLLSQAASALPDDFAVHFVRSLVQSQDYMDSSWCAVYQTPESVLKLFPVNKRNLRRQAVEEAMDYIKLYADDC